MTIESTKVVSTESAESPASAQVSAIDAAIAAAKARKAAKGKGSPDGTLTLDKPVKAEKPAKEPKAPKVTDAERAEKLAKILAERSERKAAKAVTREAKLAAAAAAKSPAHMSKVAKAAAKLPVLASAGQRLFDEITANLPAAEITSLAAHLQHFNRCKATERSADAKLVAGDSVTITGGDPRFIGKVGKVSKAQRIRCYVDVPVENGTRSVYLFTSDVRVNAPVGAAAPEATGTDGLQLR